MTLCPVEKITNTSPHKVKHAAGGEDLLLLDVRETSEHINGHIDGSMHIPLRELAYRADELPRDRRVVAYCRSGNRSLGAAMLLCAHGFDNVENMEGGILSWPYEVVSN